MGKFKEIRRIITREKVKTVLKITMLAMVVSAYFIVCYFLAEKSFA